MGKTLTFYAAQALNGTVVVAPPAPPAFSPAILAGLAAWYDPSDAATLTQASSQATALMDKGPNNYHLAANDTTQPYPVVVINGRSALQQTTARNGHLNSTGTPAKLNFNGATPFTVWAVLQGAVTDPTQFSWLAGFTDNATTGGWVLRRGSEFANGLGLAIQQGYGGPSASAHVPAAAFSANTNSAVIFSYDGSGQATGIHCSLNGTSQTMTVVLNNLPAGTGASTGAFCLGTSIASAQNLDAIGELGVCAGVMAASDQTALVSYLRAKWGF